MAGTNRVALITGASPGGSGLATALALAAAGWITYATARRTAQLPIAPGLRFLPLDVTDEASMIAAVRTIESEHGRVDALVNNAAYGEMGPVETVTLEQMRRQFETNVFGLVRLTQLVLPGMRRRGWGRIVNLSSLGGEMTTPFAGFYHATKYAVESLSDALRMEVKPFGIEVVVIQPGGIDTPLAQNTVAAIPADAANPYAAELQPFRQLSAMLMENAAQMMVTPEQIARVIVTALQAERPLTRYKVSTADHTAANIARDEADRQRDAALRQQLGLPA